MVQNFHILYGIAQMIRPEFRIERSMDQEGQLLVGLSIEFLYRHNYRIRYQQSCKSSF